MAPSVDAAEVASLMMCTTGPEAPCTEHTEDVVEEPASASEATLEAALVESSGAIRSVVLLLLSNQ